MITWYTGRKEKIIKTHLNVYEHVQSTPNKAKICDYYIH